MSYVKMLLTEINSLEYALVTAKKTKKKLAIAPPLPSNARAAYGNTRPAETSDSGILIGNVGNTELLSNATAANPIVVAQSQGIANQVRPLNFVVSISSCYGIFVIMLALLTQATPLRHLNQQSHVMK